MTHASSATHPRSHDRPRSGRHVDPRRSLRGLRLLVWSALVTSLVGAGLVVPLASSGAAASYLLQYSAESDRTPAFPLADAELTGSQHITLSGVTAKASVSWYVDDPAASGAPYAVERTAPFDLAGTEYDNSARPFDVDALGDGPHSVTAVVTEGKTTENVTAHFWVGARGGIDFLYSRSSDRSSPQRLSGATVAGRVYAFIPDVGGIRRVTFWMDNPRMSGSGLQAESKAPWDLGGGIGDLAQPYDTRYVKDGSHTVTALVELAKGASEVLSWTFTVRNTAVPTPTPTPTPAPPVVSAPTVPVPVPPQVPAPAPAPAPGSGAFPGAHNTGVPAGVTLTPFGLNRRVTTDNAVIDGKDIVGCLTIVADNVTITRSRIRCGGPHGIRVLDGFTNLVVEDSEIDGSSGEISAAVCCGNYTLRRVDIHDVMDGPRLGDNTVIEDSWIHDLKRVPGSHNDALQIQRGTNVTVRRNNLQAYNAVTKDPMNAVLMVGSLTGDVTNFRFEHNLVNGGNYTIFAGYGDVDYSMNDFVIRGNRFGRDFRYGLVRSLGGTTVWDATNVWHDSGLPVR
jgi:hypothetical protein